jgi:glutamine amidotransferase
MISIINYGMGNLGSIQNMLKKVGVASKIIDSPEECIEATKIILPGVGHFEEGMRVLNENKWIEVLNEKIPVLGICLGMQLMTSDSEEGNCKGLNWVDAHVKKFRFTNSNIKIPHMGWNEVQPRLTSPLFDKFETFDEIRFYHVHSYYVQLENPELEISSTNYGSPFVSGFQNDNIYGVQFHPEKSHKYGMRMLSNFANI